MTMATNPAGRVFISYRRSPGREAGDVEACLLRNALRDRGVPTWRDLDDLDAAPTQEYLVASLSDYDTAGAVMLISPETESSSMVRKVEAPEIFERFMRKDGFFVKPVLIGLQYDEIDRVLGWPSALQEVGQFNIDRIEADTFSRVDARRIAATVVKTRLSVIKEKGGNTSFTAGVFTRHTPNMSGYSLSHDFTHYFHGRSASEGAYHNIEVALSDTASALTATGERVSLTARGNAPLPLGVLYGAVFSPFIFDLTWKQSLPGLTAQDWSRSQSPSSIAVKTDVARGNLDSEDLVLMVSVNAEVSHAVREYLSLSKVSQQAMISVSMPGGPVKQGQALLPEDGLAIANAAIDKAKSVRAQLRLKRATLHLFLACPLGLAVLIGQMLNTFSACVVYEHFSDEKPAYKPVHKFNPSDIES